MSFYAARETTRGAYAALAGVPLPDGVDPAQRRRIYLTRTLPFVTVAVRDGDEPPPYGTRTFATRAQALHAARRVGGPGERVAIPAPAGGQP